MKSLVRMVGESKKIPLKDLRLDANNPRLVSSKSGDSQIDLAINIEMAHECLTVAKSIARNGFFTNEPLIVIAGNQDDPWVVVEGNRRLTALLGLAFKSFRSEFFQAEAWDQLASQASLDGDSEIPCVVISNRTEVSSIIGFRHISGILDWTPYAQAAYIAQLVDDEGLDFVTISEMIGKKKVDVANLYRNFRIAKQAQGHGIGSAELEGAFSLLTVAMSSPHLRSHIGAPSGPGISTASDPIPSAKVTELRELIGWIFGDAHRPAIIEDSRQLSALGRVVANDNGLKALRAGAKTLEAAEAAIEVSGLDPLEKLRRHLTAALSATKSAAATLSGTVVNEEIEGLISELEDETASLRQMLEDTEN